MQKGKSILDASYEHYQYADLGSVLKSVADRLHFVATAMDTSFRIDVNSVIQQGVSDVLTGVADDVEGVYAFLKARGIATDA